jgi:hypothetical protein
VIDTWFFGRSSCLAALEDAFSLHSGGESTRDGQQAWTFSTVSSNPKECPEYSLPPVSVSFALFSLFSRSVNIFYPTLKEQHLNDILANAYNSQASAAAGHDRDLFFLVLAIGSRLTRNPDLSMVVSPEMCLQKAARRIERSRHSWVGREQLRVLQRTLLTCIYLLLSPSSGDAWRNLGFAIRTYLDLSHRPVENDDMDEELLCMLSRTLYCLEWYDELLPFPLDPSQCKDAVS